MRLLSRFFFLFCLLLVFTACRKLGFKCDRVFFVMPIEMQPMQDTFQINDTIHFSIDFPDEYEYEGKIYKITTDEININFNMSYPSDKHVNDGTALKDIELIVDINTYNLSKLDSYSNNYYSIWGDVKKIDNRFKLKYSMVFQDTGLISMRFMEGASKGRGPIIEFEEGCLADFYFHLQLPPGQDDNWDVFEEYWEGFIERIGYFEYESHYRNHGSFTFYVDE